MNQLWADAQRAGRALFHDGLQRIAEAAGGPARLQVIIPLAAIFALDAADTAAIAAVADSLKSSFHLGNPQIGLLISAASFTGAILTLPAGAFVDRVCRKCILIAVIILWTLATFATGLATSFMFLLAARIALGGLTAAASPAIASLVGDFFPARDRARVYGLVLAGELIGTGAGYFFAGEISTWLGWRWPFYVMTLPSIAVIWVIWRFLPEPARGGQDWIFEGQQEIEDRHGEGEEQNAVRQDAVQDNRASGSKPPLSQEALRRAGFAPDPKLVLHENPARRSLWWAVAYLLKIPTYRLLIITSALGYYFFSGVRGFGMIYLTQHYGVSRGILSALVLILGVGAIAGVLLGAYVSGWLLRRRWLNARILVPSGALLMAAAFVAPAVWTKNVFLGIALLTFGAAAIAAVNPPLDAARLDIIHPGLWGRAEAGRIALRSALEGSAPLLFGLASDWLGGGQVGLKWTFLIMLCPLLVASFLAFFARRSYLRDVATARASANATRAAH